MLAVGSWIVSAAGVGVLAQPVNRAITIKVTLTRNIVTPFTSKINSPVTTPSAANPFAFALAGVD
jgi:hypothetical protein